ncbi:MAG: site-2 protease family protein [Clostridia bacterium]|nr:site-2 protease family protein [Clostridia bacterium]
MIDILLQILYTVLVLGFLIFIHEFGHFICAKLTKTKVNEFALGMGPAILKKQIGETLYALRLFPIGGYVAMEGEDESSDDPNAFNKKSLGARLLIVFAGAFMNLVVGVVITFILVLQSPALPTLQIAQFDEDAISDDSGLMVGDIITEIDGSDVNVYTDITTIFSLNYNKKTIDVTVLRGGEEILIKDVAFPVTEYAEGLNGFLLDFKVYGQEKTVGSVLKETVYRTGSYITMMYKTLAQLITGEMSIKYVSGPVGISDALYETAQLGFSAVLSMTALISLNLAVMNLLPLPALDGGRIVFLLYELIFRRKAPQKFEAIVNFAGLVLLLALMVVIVFKDIFFPIT